MLRRTHRRSADLGPDSEPELVLAGID